ncbi:putative disease resistance protein At1g50180 [Juglans microcarpa x Juglans regia]|uniref:putative disease resistance protein At1g50180 n=1 Tax=Juglans microcarpa x Juglans regia TaxID=2249226 RepID=UPI001B7E74A3|nr:putative disease resistance protein At1g50180 [Juglans microcarpa x Juglans regia]
MEGGGPSSLSEKIREQRQTYAHVEYDHVVVGLEDNLKEVVACLTGEVKYKYKVVSICGMVGLRKTTLARKVYHHQEVKSHFNCRAWACISQQCQRRDVWEGVMIGLISPSKEQRDEIRSLRDEELAEKLCEVQRQNKCLVVLDDIWKVEDWNSLCAAFPMNDTNSRILLTSRTEDLALQVDPRGRLHKLPFLNDENSWGLLQNLAISWRSEDSKIKEDMSCLGKEMVTYCKGLPLAVIVLGGLLATKQTLEEWKHVHRNVKSYIHQQKDLGINTVLALSYDDLPSHLKLCFLYLGHFPEDFEIRTKELIQMWMAEGLILQTGSNKETLEDVGERYLQELDQRCIVQVGQKSFVAGINLSSP